MFPIDPPPDKPLPAVTLVIVPPVELATIMEPLEEDVIVIPEPANI